LAERMEQGWLPLGDAVRIVAEVADALGYAHAQGYVHRDIKPANVLLDGGGRAYLTDFGIAVVEAELLKDVRAAGTLPYMAPEQLDETLGPVDHRADIHALGVLLFELLTGRRLFESGSPLELRERILAGEFSPPRSIDSAVSEGLDEICRRCLARRPNHRYRDAGALAAELRTLADR
ncbi:MAG: serine/threonine-protein kinase, partial [Isosphaeraceae bacterium]